MRLEKINIRHYRSIENISVIMPKNKPLILFGPNNAGKSNILSAFDRILGERYPTFIAVEDSDYFMRDKNKNPTIDISLKFDSSYHVDNYNSYSSISLTYGVDGKINENLIHDGNKKKLYISNDTRESFQSFLLDANRNTSFHFNYSNKYSLLSKFNKSLHDSLTDEDKRELSHSFENIKSVFENKAQFANMFTIFKDSIEESVKGFIHHLEADFSAYDPNNFAKSLRINALENSEVRSFDEFGTGEQQVLVMAFAKAYMEAFKGRNFLFILEEPEANLHPLAQKWLKKYIYDLCESGLQIIISTHSPNFINPSNLEGLVRVYKDEGVTKTIQLDSSKLKQVLIETGVDENRISPNNLGDYFDLRLYSEQLEGMFADTIILVEGLTEKLSIPIWLERKKYFLSANGIEIINCMGKANIPTLYRLYKSFGYRCICVFDGDINKTNPKERKNNLLEDVLEDFEEAKIDIEDKKEYYSVITGSDYVCFGKDYETAIMNQIGKNYYMQLENEAKAYNIENKQGIAKYIAENSSHIPIAIDKLIAVLFPNMNEENNEDYCFDDEIPF